jgi:hypothetical protein
MKSSRSERTTNHHLLTFTLLMLAAITRLVGRPGLDPGTLGALLEGPCTCMEMQIRWSHGEVCAPTSSGVLSDPILWHDLLSAFVPSRSKTKSFLLVCSSLIAGGLSGDRRMSANRGAVWIPSQRRKAASMPLRIDESPHGFRRLNSRGRIGLTA